MTSPSCLEYGSSLHSSLCHASSHNFAPFQAQQENDEAEAVYEVMNSHLLEGLPQLVEMRVAYLDPSFEAMVRCQLRFAEEGYEKMSGVQR